MSSIDSDLQFAGIGRLFNGDALGRLRAARVMVIGIGGVGSWAAEALARSGVGQIKLVDLDEVCMSNITRQVHAMQSTVGRAKIDVMAERLEEINPEMKIERCHEFFMESTADKVLEGKYDYVLDAIDSVKNKTLLIVGCRNRGLPVVTVGGAGGRLDASQIQITDLSRTYRDGLLQNVRKRLRQKHGFPKGNEDGSGKKFGIPCVFTSEEILYPHPQGHVCTQKPEMKSGSMRLSCEQGLGAASFVTGTMGFVAAGLIVRHVATGEMSY